MRDTESSITVRPAGPEDAAAACAVLRRSILDLCREDHGDDPAVLAAWLANKTPAQVAGWIAAPKGCVLVAEISGAVCGVGSIGPGGRIGLNYVAPEARFRGVSSALLASLEAWARARGLTHCSLESTATARRFYLARGYAETGPPQRQMGATGIPMAKPLGQ
ncbi:GNAT family N-acetyltransferase [Paracraurococcus lichenis]|uniref:GNAT family N-acetyltransferase n=1 Tax=Paracraurococcus lichenis TaxID=3064888 RepID=A0ABT9DUY7_9PROT|nr:GNAT family N-acetyltransferase [Paracraurococcus sp. LOR1-02]MDO9707709.1 GNAT family N-acetyltransferase [Paracraurococcus sp. LOR1-02]